MKLTIVIMALLLLAGIGSAVNTLPATTFVGDIDFASGYYARNATEGVYNVLDYGADNTGTTDASTIIQSVIDAANAAGGGIVYIPAGTYLLETDQSPGKPYKCVLVPKSNVSIYGAGMDVTILKLGDGVRDVTRGASILYCQTGVLRHFSLRDLTIDYNAPTNQGTNGEEYSWFTRTGAWYVDTFVIERVKWYNMSGFNGVGIGGSGHTAYESRDVIIRNCIFHNIGRYVDPNQFDVSAIHVWGTHTIVDGNIIYNDDIVMSHLGSGIEVHGSPTVVSNNFIHNYTNGILSAYIVPIAGVTDADIIIRDNILDGVEHGIEYWNGGSEGQNFSGRCENLIIEGNFIKLRNHYRGAIGVSPYLDSPSNLMPHNTIIQGNTFVGDNLDISKGNYAINWRKVTGNISVNGNYIHNIWGIGVAISLVFDGITGENVVSIEQNMIIGLNTAQGIAANFIHGANANLVSIRENTIEGTASTSYIYMYCDNVTTGHAKNIFIEDNIFGSSPSITLENPGLSKVYVRHVSPNSPPAITPINGSMWLDTTNGIQYMFNDGWKNMMP